MFRLGLQDLFNSPGNTLKSEREKTSHLERLANKRGPEEDLFLQSKSRLSLLPITIVVNSINHFKIQNLNTL